MKLLQMSLAGSVMILAALLVRKLFLSRIPKQSFSLIWLAVAFRLLLPVSISSPVSIYPVLDSWQQEIEESIVEKIGTEKGGAFSSYSGDFPENESLALEAKVSSSKIKLDSYLETEGQEKQGIPVWWTLWAIGMVSMLLYFVLSYRCCLRKFHKAEAVEHEIVSQWRKDHPLRRKLRIRQTDQIETPLTYGILFPVILLPRLMDWTDKKTLGYVLEHEWIHIRRFDQLEKIILAGALCLHWFNPLVWVMYFLSSRDIELACDERVVKTFGVDKKSEYAMVLISLEEKRSQMMPTCCGFGKNVMEERIGAIMKIRKASVLAGVTALLLMGGITSVFATTSTPVAEPSDGPSSAIRYAGEPTAKTALLAKSAEELQEQIYWEVLYYEETIAILNSEIDELENQSEEKGADTDEIAYQLESKKESKYASMVRLEGTKNLLYILNTYGPYGICAYVSKGDWDDRILYYDSQPIRYLADEGAGGSGVLWSAPGNRGLIVEVLRDEAGEITGLEVTEAS